MNDGGEPSSVSILNRETDLAVTGSVFALCPMETAKELSLQIVSFILL
jgi:hypothetical protein